jgi:hypothetical protein
MKKLFPTIVTTRRIASPTEQFDAAEIQALAESALQLGGFIQPPVLKRDGENYTIVSGHKQVAAAYLARTIDPENGATVSVFIIEEETEAAIMTQLNTTPTAPVETTLAPTPVAPGPKRTPAAAAPVVRQTIAQLKTLARQRGIRPTGDKRLKTTWLTALAA